MCVCVCVCVCVRARERESVCHFRSADAMLNSLNNVLNVKGTILNKMFYSLFLSFLVNTTSASIVFLLNNKAT